MVQGRGGTRLALKAVAEPGVVSKVFRQKLQGNETAKASVLRLVNDTHAARAQLFQDTVVRNGGADHNCMVNGYCKTACSKESAAGLPLVLWATTLTVASHIRTWLPPGRVYRDRRLSTGRGSPDKRSVP